MKRLPWRPIALVAVLGAAFLVQATSTWRLGERQHLADLALPALVVLLEVGSITSAAIFFSARSKGLRFRALLLLAVTAGLGGTGGVIAYGFVIGIPVAVLLLGLVEVVGAAGREATTSDQPSTTSDQEPTAVDQPATTVDQPATTVDHERAARAAARALAVERHRDAEAAPSPPVDNRVDEPARANHAARLVFADPTPTEPLPRLDDGRAVDPLPEPEPEPDDSWWRSMTPLEADYAAVLLDHPDRDGKRITERPLADALVALGFPEKGSRYRAKKYLGNATTRRLEAA